MDAENAKRDERVVILAIVNFSPEMKHIQTEEI